jgi:hypothetical protein
MDTFQKWLGTTPTGTIARVLLGTLLGWAAAELPAWQNPAVPAVLFVILQGIIPALLAYINPADTRYGRGKND